LRSYVVRRFVIARRAIFPTKQSLGRRGDCFATSARNDGMLGNIESNGDALKLPN
jgi:hypothetical protein